MSNTKSKHFQRGYYWLEEPSPPTKKEILVRAIGYTVAILLGVLFCTVDVGETLFQYFYFPR